MIQTKSKYAFAQAVHAPLNQFADIHAKFCEISWRGGLNLVECNRSSYWSMTVTFELRHFLFITWFHSETCVCDALWSGKDRQQWCFRSYLEVAQMKACGVGTVNSTLISTKIYAETGNACLTLPDSVNMQVKSSTRISCKLWRIQAGRGVGDCCPTLFQMASESALVSLIVHTVPTLSFP